MARTQLRRAWTWAAGALGLAASTYAGYVGVTWLRYGHAAPPDAESHDPLLDRFMPVYDIAERHHIRVAAPAEITFAAACDADLQDSPFIRGIFRAREIILGSKADTIQRPRGLLAVTKSLGWGMLAEVPGREVVMAAGEKIEVVLA